MTAGGVNIFLMEAIVRRLTLTGTEHARNTCPVCVCLKFPGLVEMDICEGDFCGCQNNQHIMRDGCGIEVRITHGKSCLFAVSASDLCRTARNFLGTVTVYRRVAGTETRFVAEADIEFDRWFTDLFLEPNHPDRTRQLEQDLILFDGSRSKPDGNRCKPIGSINVDIRLTSHGDLLITQFEGIPHSNKYQYKDVSEYVPVNAKVPEKCLDENICTKKHRKHKSSCRKKKPETAGRGEGTNASFSKQMTQVKCILTAMEKMKDLFMRSVEPSAKSASNDIRVFKPCVFDPNCPVANCPFRADEPIGAFIDRMIEGVDPKLAEKDPRRATLPKTTEIEDDADLFTMKVGRIDHCRFNVPCYKDNCTQYRLTDIPPEYWPPPEPVVVEPEPKPKKNKKNNKKKNKKRKQ